jgi:two-component system nitrate/nitrite response regulator NarL
MTTATPSPPQARPEADRHVGVGEVSAAELLPVGIVTLGAVPPDPRPMETSRMSQTAKRVSVVVVDDHPVFREGVVRALTSSGRVEVVAEAGDGRDALAQIEEHRPDVVLLDYKLPELSGLAVAHAIVRDGLPTKILFLSAHTESSVVYAALEAGASGFLSKEARREQIVDAVVACAAGRNVLPSDVAAGLVSEIRLRSTDDAPVLTNREREILKLIAAGRSLPEIANELVLGLTTVKTHTQHLYDKLGVSDRAAAVAEAMRRGLIE